IFFFQAEDGIRDRNVTGVQTCALPILQILYQHHLDYVSGQYIAEQLKISRTSVKKIMDQLKTEGCEIESVNHKGHRLINLPDKWYSGLVLPIIEAQQLFDHVAVYDSLLSTQLEAKQQL